MELKWEEKHDDTEDGGNVWYTRKLLVLPGCCEKSIKALRPYLVLDDPNGYHESDEGLVPVWRIPHMKYDYAMSFIAQRARYDEWSKAYQESCVEPEYCPYCATKLPEVRLKKDPPAPVVSFSDGYCNTCEERLMCCGCWPREALYEVVDGS